MRSDPAARPPLDVARLAAAAPEVLPGLSVEVVEVAGSTNAVVAERALAGAPGGLVVVAEHQTAGRGRLDRVWEAPARSALTFSLLVRPTAPPQAWPWLPLLAGAAVGRALEEAGFEAALKWPNDVLLAGADGQRLKVAGVLVERVETPSGPAAVIGVGINVAMTAAELPVPEATSLAVAGREVPDRTDLLVDVLAGLWKAYAAWQAGGEPAGELAGDGLVRSYAAACTTIGRTVRVQLPSGGALVGTATGIDASGRLVVEHHGVRTPVSAGDVVHVR